MDTGRDNEVQACQLLKSIPTTTTTTTELPLLHGLNEVNWTRMCTLRSSIGPQGIRRQIGRVQVSGCLLPRLKFVPWGCQTLYYVVSAIGNRWRLPSLIKNWIYVLRIIHNAMNCIFTTKLPRTSYTNFQGIQLCREDYALTWGALDRHPYGQRL